jgi:hypothetical protein
MLLIFNNNSFTHEIWPKIIIDVIEILIIKTNIKTMLRNTDILKQIM